MSEINNQNHINTSLRLTGASKTGSSGKIENIKAGKAPQIDISDKFETTRSQRIQKFFDKAQLQMADKASLFSMGAVGGIIATAVTWSVFPHQIAIAAAAGLGALAGMEAKQYGIDVKVGKALQKGINIALTPAVIAGRHMKKAFSHLFKLIKPGNEDEKKSELGNDKKSLSKNMQGNISNGKKVEESNSERQLKKAGNQQTASKLAGSLGTVAKAARSAPDIIYPSIKGATEAQKAMIMETLDQLPLSHVTATNSITINPDLASKVMLDTPEGTTVAGLCRDLLFDRPVDVDQFFANIPGEGEGVLIHEMGHAADMSKLPGPFLGRSLQAPFGEGPYIFDPSTDFSPNSTYASTNMMEDFAQSYKAYHTDPAALKAQCPEKFAAMEEFHEPGLYDKVLDKTGVREVGKNVAETIDKVPGLRTTLEVAGAVTGPITIRMGAHKLEKGIKENDVEKKFRGKMEMAAGAAYSSRFLAPLGLGITGAKWIMGKMVKKGKLTVERAHAISSKFLASMTGPLGLITLAAANQMTQPREGEEHIKTGTIKNTVTEKPAETEAMKKKGTAGKSKKKKKKEPTPYDLTWDDKKYMAKVGAGAVVGGATGTVAGYVAGSTVGATIGALVGGPLGASVLGLAGAAVGTLAGSYKMAQAGAKIADGIGKKKPESMENNKND